MKKTFSAKKETVERNWQIIDLKGKVLGRAATLIADVLRGKNKPTFTHHVDTGDFVIAINAKEVKLTGNKEENKVYIKHTGFMGGIREINAKKQLEKDPTVIIKKAVKGMLPRGSLGRKQFSKFKVYADANHPHAAQKPQTLEL